jgi:hypothetical protein
MEKLEKQASNEGFLDVMLGGNCYTQAVQSLKQSCTNLDADGSMWLAFQLANCLFSKTRRRTYPCAQDARSISSCIMRMQSEDYIVFSQFLTHVHSMCVFIANTDFQTRAETMLNTLFAAGADASEKACRDLAC